MLLKLESADVITTAKSGFPKVGFANPWWFVRELQGVRELVHSMPKSVYH